VSVSPRWLLAAPLLVSYNAGAQTVPAPAPPPAPTISAVAPTLAAQPEVSVEALIQLALANNPQLPFARENLEAARQRAAGARAILNPTIQAVPRILGDRNAADTEIIVSQPIDVFGRRRALARVLEAGVNGAEAANLLAERSLVVQVKNAASDLFAAQESENLGVVQLEVAQLFRNAAARRAAVGDVPAVQVQRADLELARTRNELNAARAERGARRAALNQLVGRAPETPLRVALPIAADFAAILQVPSLAKPGALGTGVPSVGAPGGVPQVGATGATGVPGATNPNVVTPDVGGITPPAAGGSLPGNVPSTALSPSVTLPGSGDDAPITGASSQVGSDLVAQRAALLPGALVRPDIVGAQANLAARQAQVKAISRQRLPDIELQVRRGSFFGQGPSGTALRAVLTLPIFDFGSIGREKNAAQAEVRAQEAQISLLQQQAATQVEQALIRLAQQRQTVETYRTELVPQTLDLLRKTQIGYAAGASTYLEVLDAQRTLRQVQTEYLQALVGTRTNEAALESALGAAPPASLVGPLTNPTGAAAPPGVSAPGTIGPDVIPPNLVTPLDPPRGSVPPPQNDANPDFAAATW